MSVPDLLATAVAALGGSERSGQLRMATAVADAFETGEHLAVQAGTGTGKSLAYLVPAIVRAVSDETPVVVSTATIALQRQLVNRDLPQLVDALTDALPRTPRFALLKGRQNYLCLNKIHNGAAASSTDESQDELFEPQAVTAVGRDVQRLTAWAATTWRRRGPRRAPVVAWNLPSDWTFRLSPGFGLNDNSHQFLLRWGVSREADYLWS